MKTVISLRNEKKNLLPENFRNDDVRYTEELVEYFLNEFTKEGETVLDPFLGFGTSLVVAEKMNRIGYGIEYDHDRCKYVQSLLTNPDRAIHGDSTKLKLLNLPDIDFSITSPPYMGQHHKENPFTSYSTEGTGYGDYLGTLQDIYRQVKERLKPKSFVVIEVSNLKHDDGPLTTLAWDIGKAISKVLEFTGEIIVHWEDGYGFGYDHSYCLIFQNS